MKVFHYGDLGGFGGGVKVMVFMVLVVMVFMVLVVGLVVMICLPHHCYG